MRMGLNCGVGGSRFRWQGHRRTWCTDGRRAALTAAAFLQVAFVAYGADVRVEKSGADKIALSLSELRTSGAPGSVFARVLEEDLQRSGWFIVTRVPGAIAVQGSAEAGAGRLIVQCRVMKRADGRCFLSEHYREPSGKAASLAHRVADDIVLAVKGVQGIASTRIAMVGARGGKRDIYTCRPDGSDMLQVTRDGTPCLGPAWGPEGRRLYYTSMHKGFPDVYAIDFSTTQRRREVSYPGINTGADMAPDGRIMALALSKDGNPDLYAIQLDTRRLTRLTRSPHASEASPSWSPDGLQLVFVSDRSGSPQIYVTDRGSGRQKRLTFRGRENVSPDWGPDGRIAFSSRRDGCYRLCIMDPATGRCEQLTTDYADYEDPSWAPDGRHLVCSRTERYRSEVYILDTMGDPPLRLTTLKGDWYSPAWSP